MQTGNHFVHGGLFAAPRSWISQVSGRCRAQACGAAGAGGVTAEVGTVARIAKRIGLFG